MKKNLVFVLILQILVLPCFAKITFGSSDLNKNDEVLFVVNQDMTGTNPYRSLFYAKLKNGQSEKAPQLLTCYPEQMELLGSGTILQLRNRYGTARYDTVTDSVKWIEITDKIPVNSLPVAPYASSPNGKWICKIEKETMSSGTLIIQNIDTGKSAVLCEAVRQSYERLPVKWAPDSSVLIYEKNGNLYFCNPDAILRKVEMDEKYRKIGRGTINSVNWASERNLVYIDDYLVYQINAKELYTVGLYSGIIGQGKAIGRLPSQFNATSDKFSVNSAVNSIVIIQNNRLFTYLKQQTTTSTCDYMDVIYSKPYTDSTASLVDAFVFWDSSNSPILWLEKFPYNGKGEVGAVYKLGQKTAQVLAIEDSGKPFISPDGSKVAFFAGAAVYVYDINNWQRVAELTGEKVTSALWLNRNTIFVGGDRTVRKWNILSNTNDVLFLSSATGGYWSASGNEIYADTGNGNYYEYNKSHGTWRKAGSIELAPQNENGKYRMFTGSTPNKQFENALYIRTLSRKAVTKPMYEDSVIKNTGSKKVALVFDAYDNADGLPKVLACLKKYNISGTFFMNGEFIRRYPSETKQIINNGYDTGSMFFSATDLVNNPFIVDEDFVRRGLARNEDEFFNCTGNELSLYWHAPYYSAEPAIVKAGQNAGYTYINSYSVLNDSEILDKDIKPEQIIQSYCDSLRTTNGGIVPVTVGFSQGNRTDPLYNYLDLLICALVDAGFDFVNVNEL